MSRTAASPTRPSSSEIGKDTTNNRKDFSNGEETPQMQEPIPMPGGCRSGCCQRGAAEQAERGTRGNRFIVRAQRDEPFGFGPVPPLKADAEGS
jgi:hypothetical protein